MQAKKAYPSIFGYVKVVNIILVEFGKFYPVFYRSYCGRKSNFRKYVSAVTGNISVKGKKQTKR